MSYPAWAATTAYIAGARVTKVTDDGTNWYVVTAGTTAAAEPTWPTAAPWTVTDGTVGWGLASSFRQQAVTGIMAVLTTFATANPTILAASYSARPKSGTVADWPHAYLDGRPEMITHAHDIRTRTISVPVVLRDLVSDNAQTLARMDTLIDGLVDAFSLNFHTTSGYSITVETGTIQASDTETELPMYVEALTISAVLTEGYR